MGAVHEEQRNEGKGTQEWYKLSLSDTTVIDKLIRNRSRLDPCYVAKQFANGNPFLTNGVPDFAEPIAVMYMDLETLIDACRFDDRQKYIIRKLMLGYSETDIAYYLNVPFSTIRKRIDPICLRIKEKNDELWRNYLETAGFVKIPDDIKYKKCSKCGEFKRMNSDNFPPSPTNRDGFKKACRQCR